MYDSNFEYRRPGYDSRSRQSYTVQSLSDAWTANERWYKAANVVWSIVSILTVPVISAVCAGAAVVFTQRTKANLTLRQLTILADHGWASPAVYGKLLTSQRRRIMTSLLALAIGVTILGAIMAPLAAIFVSIRPVQVPTSSFVRGQTVVDIPDIANPRNDHNFLPTQLRSLMKSNFINSPQAR